MYAEIRITDFDGAHCSGRRIAVKIGEETVFVDRVADADSWIAYRLPAYVCRRLLGEATTIGVALDSRPFASRGRWLGEMAKQDDGSYLGDSPAKDELVDLGVLAA